MIIVSLIFLTFIGMNIFLNSVRTKKINEYINDIEKDLSEKLKTIE